jgi:hypothetical protein
MDLSYDAFISHCGKDCKRDFAVLLKERLEGVGIRCFLDERDLQLGDHAAEGHAVSNGKSSIWHCHPL